MKKIIFVIAFSFPWFLWVKAQGDVITVMHYNLMMYGVKNSWTDTTNCSNLGLNYRDNCLRKIIKHYSPDIFTINEISEKISIQSHLLASCLNIDGVDYYKMAIPTDYSSSPGFINQVCYNSEKFELCFQDSIFTQNSNRDINVYKFYYKAYDLASVHDSAFIYCFVMHLPQAPEDRAGVTTKLMNYLTANNIKDNYLTMGDFNIDFSSEVCYQNMINPSDVDYRFNDPLNQPGVWTESSFSNIHTQSTRVSDNDPCTTAGGAGGGMDNRFDFILASNNIMNFENHYGYVAGSYTAIGQDGLHYDKSIKDEPANTSAAPEIIDALYCMSDHLPVLLKMNINQSVFPPVEEGKIEVVIKNPVDDNMIVTVRIHSKTKLSVKLLNVLGQDVFSKDIEDAGIITQFTIPGAGLRKGMYFLKISDSENNNVTQKLFKP